MNHPCIAAMLKGRGDAKAPEILMLALLILSHDENHVTEGSFEWLAKLYGCNDRNAKLLIAKLKASGLLKVSKTAPKSGHAQNAYRVTTCGGGGAPKTCEPPPWAEPFATTEVDL